MVEVLGLLLLLEPPQATQSFKRHPYTHRGKFAILERLECEHIRFLPRKTLFYFDTGSICLCSDIRVIFAEGSALMRTDTSPSEVTRLTAGRVCKH